MEILLLEDNPGDVRYINELFKEEKSFKFKMFDFELLQKGIKWLTNEKPDVILLDLGLPDSQGLDTLIKIAPLVPYIPIIVLTGLNDKEVALQALKANAQDYLVKGEFNRELLLRVINYSIERKQLENIIAANEERLRLALKASKQGLYDFDINSGNIVVNEYYSLMLGVDPQYFTETYDKFLERVHPDDIGVVREIYQNYREGKIEDHRIEFRVQKNTGDWIWVLSLGSVIKKDNEGKHLRMIGTHTDITESKTATIKIAQLLSESQRRLQKIETLHKIDSAISTDNQLETTLSLLLEQVKNQLQVDAAAILLFDKSEEVFIHAANIGFYSQRISNSKVKLGESLAGRATIKDEIIRVQNIAEKNIDPFFRFLMYEEKIKDYFSISLFAKGMFIGVLEVFFRSSFTPDDEWDSYLRVIAGLAAIAIENGQLISGLQNANANLLDAYDETIIGWSNALDLRDKETEGHSLRVTDMTIALARRLTFQEDEIKNIWRGALLHDIGKMGVPDSILLKPGVLTDEERKIMQKHPVFAYKLLRPISFLHSSLDIPRYHHEKWDGTGYPDGLLGDQIPLAARLFSIVDVYDALLSDRPYRKAWLKEFVLDYIQKQSGTFFEPQLVRLFFDFIEHPPQKQS